MNAYQEHPLFMTNKGSPCSETSWQDQHIASHIYVTYFSKYVKFGFERASICRCVACVLTGTYIKHSIFILHKTSIFSVNFRCHYFVIVLKTSLGKKWNVPWIMEKWNCPLIALGFTKAGINIVSCHSGLIAWMLPSYRISLSFEIGKIWQTNSIFLNYLHPPKSLCELDIFPQQILQ